MQYMQILSVDSAEVREGFADVTMLTDALIVRQ